MTAPPSSANPMPLEWEEFRLLSPREKAPYFRDRSTPDRTSPLSEPTNRGVIQMCIYSQQFDRPLLDRMFRVAEAIRASDANSELRREVKQRLGTRSGALYFTQPSTRTYTSFSLAARATGLMCEEIRDSEMSSLYKGESEIDTLLTLAELADCIIMRQGSHSLIEQLAWELRRRDMNTRVVNGGSGPEQHPTQSLLDLYTLVSHRNFDEPSRDFSVGIVGDLMRSRTARSLAYLLALYPHIRQVFIAPDELQMGKDLLDYLDENHIDHTCSDQLDQHLPDLDVVYMMRIQDEYGTTSNELRSKYEQFQLTVERTKRMKPDAQILHPLPRRQELPPEIDLDPRAAYWEAVNRGKYVRMALLLHMFGADDGLS